MVQIPPAHAAADARGYKDRVRLRLGYRAAHAAFHLLSQSSLRAAAQAGCWSVISGMTSRVARTMSAFAGHHRLARGVALSSLSLLLLRSSRRRLLFARVSEEPVHYAPRRAGDLALMSPSATAGRLGRGVATTVDADAGADDGGGAPCPRPRPGTGRSPCGHRFGRPSEPVRAVPTSTRRRRACVEPETRR